MVTIPEEGKYNPKIREDLDKADWQEISLQLLWYAVSKARMLLAMGIADVDHEDLIQEAISLAYGVGPNDTYRNWNKEIYPDLAGFLRSVIKSIVSHKKDHHKKFKSETSSLDDALGDKELFPLSPENPQELVIQNHDLKNLKEAIYELVKEDEEIGMVLLCLEDRISKPQEIAEEINYDINKVNNALKRLRRKTKKLLQKIT
jgi:DNA-directed RNA polymerase specialized sigma24 family protein